MNVITANGKPIEVLPRSVVVEYNERIQRLGYRPRWKDWDAALTV
jgi:hypothetical protein